MLQVSHTKFTIVIGFDKKNSHVEAQHFQAVGSPTKLMNINAKQDEMFLNQTNSIVQYSGNFQSTPPTSQDESNFSDATDVTSKALSDLSRTQEPKVTVLTLGNKPPKELLKKNDQKGLVKDDCVIEDATV